jgi:CDP-paratose 2-epimerase
MRTVIITGSAGLIGSEAVKRFAKDGVRVVSIDNDRSGQNLFSRGATYFYIDK